MFFCKTTTIHTQSKTNYKDPKLVKFKAWILNRGLSVSSHKQQLKMSLSKKCYNPNYSANISFIQRDEWRTKYDPMQGAF